MEWLLGIVAFGILCGIVLISELRKDRKVTEKDILYTRIVGSESQKSAISAIKRCMVGIFICEMLGDLIDTPATMVDALLCGLIGAITARNNDVTIFLIKYPADADYAITKVRNDSAEFGRLCGYLKE